MQSLKITPPEGFEIDKEKSSFEEIVFKPILLKFPTSIKEIERRFYISGFGKVEDHTGTTGTSRFMTDNHVSTKERAEKLLKFIQLLELRDAWWKVLNWKPDWTDGNLTKHCIQIVKNKIDRVAYGHTNIILAFPNIKICDDFLDTFKDLIEECKEFL